MNTIRLTTGQAIIRFLDAQYVRTDGHEQKFVNGVFGIFGHGCVVGLGEALQEPNHSLTFYQGHSEQGMTHAAIAYAKQNIRRRIMAVTASIGPGSMNMVTAAATATVNRVPVLLLPSDTFAGRQPDPVLQQMEQFHDYTMICNDAFRSVCRYWDRISRPEQVMTGLLSAMRVLTDPAETGAVCLSLPQDVQAESYDYPEEFFRKRVHTIDRRPLEPDAVPRIADRICASTKPLVICGGGIRYSEAGHVLAAFCQEFEIPFTETQAGKGGIPWGHPMNLGGIGVTGGAAANRAAAESDLILAIGTRLSDFTTASKSAFKAPDAKILALNVNKFDAYKMDGEPFICDAREGLTAVAGALRRRGYRTIWAGLIPELKAEWDAEVERVYSIEDGPSGYSQMRALGILNETVGTDGVVVGSSGSLPGDMQRMWRCSSAGGYHMEYGFSCMGYEVSGALGVKMAEPDREVYAMVGDGSFVMLHSELLTSLQEGSKINVVLFDNGGFGCIDNLQRSQGIPKFGCEFKRRNPETGRLDEGGEPLPIDYAAIARGYGCEAWTVHDSEELRRALEKAKRSPVSTLIDIKVDFDSMSDGYESWWRVGVPEVSEKASVVEAHRRMEEMVERARKF